MAELKRYIYIYIYINTGCAKEKLLGSAFLDLSVEQLSTGLEIPWDNRSLILLCLLLGNTVCHIPNINSFGQLDCRTTKIVLKVPFPGVEREEEACERKHVVSLDVLRIYFDFCIFTIGDKLSSFSLVMVSRGNKREVLSVMQMNMNIYQQCQQGGCHCGVSLPDPLHLHSLHLPYFKLNV